MVLLVLIQLLHRGQVDLVHLVVVVLDRQELRDLQRVLHSQELLDQLHQRVGVTLVVIKAVTRTQAVVVVLDQ